MKTYAYGGPFGCSCFSRLANQSGELSRITPENKTNPAINSLLFHPGHNFQGMIFLTRVINRLAAGI